MNKEVQLLIFKAIKRSVKLVLKNPIEMITCLTEEYSDTVKNI